MHRLDIIVAFKKSLGGHSWSTQAQTEREGVSWKEYDHCFGMSFLLLNSVQWKRFKNREIWAYVLYGWPLEKVKVNHLKQLICTSSKDIHIESSSFNMWVNYLFLNLNSAHDNYNAKKQIKAETSTKSIVK